jgi:2-polyprenyl-6-methoxyphenol hydroxylase-like FAD-dependent oxidoreductase
MPYPVLIVGAGPTGMTAALELSRLGVPLRLIEKVPSPPPGAAPLPERSRAIGVQARTLELLGMRGLSEEMLRCGHPTAGASIYGGGRRLFHLDFSRIDSRYRYLLFISQMETERILREAIEDLGVSIERGVELVAFAQDTRTADPSPVKVVLRHPDGRLEQAEAPWLIDAEGAHSTVRSTLDLPFEGRTMNETYALGDLHVDGDLAEDDFHVLSTEFGFMGLFPLGHRRFRIIAGVPPSEVPGDAAPALADLQAIYDERFPVPARFSDLRWASWFSINSRMVPLLRVGRVLLGGDAAHIHSPAAAQGMNTGIQDMINLAWKLALVMQGQAVEALLDTYEQERLPVLRDVLRKTEKITDVMTSRSPITRGLLRHLAPRLGGARLLQQIVPSRISQITIGYRRSPLSAHHGHAGHLRAGDRVPDLLVLSRAAHGDGWQEQLLFGLLDPLRFTLLVVHPETSDAASADWCEAVQPWPAIRVVGLAPSSDDAARARFHAILGRSRGVLLVRPDGYVGFVGGKHASARHLDAYCRRWLITREPARPRDVAHGRRDGESTGSRGDGAGAPRPEPHPGAAARAPGT